MHRLGRAHRDGGLLGLIHGGRRSVCSGAPIEGRGSPRAHQIGGLQEGGPKGSTVCLGTPMGVSDLLGRAMGVVDLLGRARRGLGVCWSGSKRIGGLLAGLHGAHSKGWGSARACPWGLGTWLGARSECLEIRGQLCACTPGWGRR